ncbi:MAG: HlyD family efflux transporter periplasmic adaptor subunit [Candidatus Riflemargulisbacteria bacterium]
MKKNIPKPFILLVILVVIGGIIFINVRDKNKADYQGQLESEIIKLSSKAAGEIVSLPVQEGQTLSKNSLVAVFDNRYGQTRIAQNQIQQDALLYQLEAAQSQANQIAVELKLQKDLLQKTSKLYLEGATTEQNNNDLSAKVKVLEYKLQEAKARQQQLQKEKENLGANLRILNFQEQDTRILSPVQGTILKLYYHQGESVPVGAVVAEVADLSSMEARFYVPIKDLAKIKIGAEISVYLDGTTRRKGRISWVASEAEFTPKTIYTKETRTTLVYAVKVSIPNQDGSLKIGMPVDISLL